MCAVYLYEAADSAGNVLSGDLEAKDSRAVAGALEARGLLPVQISLKQQRLRHRLFRERPPAHRDILLLLQQLAILLRAGVPLVEGVSTLKSQLPHPVLLDSLVQLESKIRAGDPFTTAFGTAFPYLPAYVHQLAIAGEAIGRIANSLEDAARQMEYEHQIEQDVKNALTYPAILLVTGVAAVLFIFTVVVPRFAGFLKSAKTTLPLLSRVVLNAGMFLNENMAVLALVGIAAAFALGYAFRQPEFRKRAYAFLLSQPIIGSWLNEAETARWSSMLSTLAGNGVPLVQALDQARACLKIEVLRTRLDQVTRHVKGGKSLSAALRIEDALTPTAVSLIQVGEDSGSLSNVLESLAKLYNQSAKQRMKRFLLLLEPIAILTIGAAVGLLVAAIMLAITSMNQVAT